MMAKLETEYDQGEKEKKNQITGQDYSSLPSLLKLSLKLFLTHLPIMIGWNVLSLLVGFGNNKALLAAFTLFANMVEMSAMLIFSLGYQQKMRISYFIAKRDPKMVKKLIKYMYLTLQLNLLW